jgi:hypothetical protein
MDNDSKKAIAVIIILLFSVSSFVVIANHLWGDKKNIDTNSDDRIIKSSCKLNLKVCEVRLNDGTQCIITSRGGVACDWGLE